MDFIKRHYEKLLLLLMLVIFIGIMIYVVIVADQARKIDDTALTVQESALKKNIVTAKTATGAEFNLALILDGGRGNWRESTQRVIFTNNRKSAEGTYSDLVNAMRISTCPHCKNLIPRYYFRNNVKCPVCAVALADVPLRPKQRRRIRTENDLDGDGMPNSYETSKGFDPNDFDDQLADADRDGFSNLFEYENDTDPKNPRSRMPHWYRLKYISMDSVVLPVKLKTISHQNQLNNKSSWILQFSHIAVDRFGRFITYSNGNYREESRPYSINDEIKFDGKTYKIVDATFLQQQVGKDTFVENSTVKVVQVVDKNSKIRPDVLVMQANRDVRSNDKRLIVEDVGTPLKDLTGRSSNNGRRRYVLRVGDSLRLGNRLTGFETYRLISVDERARTASFHRANVSSGDASKDVNGKKILITRDSEIPEDVQVKAVKPKGQQAGSQQRRR